MNKDYKMREEGVTNLEVHVAGICFKDNKVLIAKRSGSRALFPGQWECGGGAIKEGEGFEEAIKRQIKEEFNIDIQPIEVFKTYKILTDSTIIPGLRFICRINELNIALSPEHSEYKLITKEELDDYEFIPGLREDIKLAFDKWKQL
jgi:8-oxo-dGTP pyrophosphatase MutT (NUDIX family)